MRQIAEKRCQANFGRFISDGPYGDVNLLAPGDTHANNGDEVTFPDGRGSFAKGLKHDPATGFPASGDYQTFCNGLKTLVGPASDAAQFLADPRIVKSLNGTLSALNQQGFKKRTHVNPLAGLGTTAIGIDPFDVAVPPAPALNSDVAAAEMVELYWMALLRDVPFELWGTHEGVAAAVSELHAINQRLQAPFAEHFEAKDMGSGAFSRAITLSRLFRGSAPGNDAGGYVSRLLLEPVRFGTLDFTQEQTVPLEGVDYMTTWESWLAVQQGDANPEFAFTGTGAEPTRGEMEKGSRRLISTLRDLAHYVHFDALHEAYFNAALILDALKAPLSPVNVYSDPDRDDRAELQRGFGTFGGPHILVLLTEVATRALQCVWHQKWFVHRRLRPEAFGGRVELATRAQNPQSDVVHEVVKNSEAVKRVHEKYHTALLPMAFPEGSPMHPSYGAGHATVAGACVTILKALFDAEFAPAPWNGLTVGGELNKLAANIAIGRNAGGVHYRTDYTKSLALGEAVALATLQEYALTFVENAVSDDTQAIWTYQNFAGKWICVNRDGSIRACKAPSQRPKCRTSERSLYAS